MEDDLKKLNVKYLSFRLKTTLIEDDLRILKVEYLSNHWSDFIQILNLS